VVTRPMALCQGVAGAIRRSNGRAVAFAVDSADAESVLTMANDIAGTFGPVEIFVNSATVTAPLGPTAGLPLHGIVRALRVNVLSIMTLAAAVVPQLRTRWLGPHRQHLDKHRRGCSHSARSQCLRNDDGRRRGTHMSAC